jgi:hypothetical protein
MVVHTCNASTWEEEAEDHEFQASPGNIATLSKKKKFRYEQDHLVFIFISLSLMPSRFIRVMDLFLMAVCCIKRVYIPRLMDTWVVPISWLL